MGFKNNIVSLPFIRQLNAESPYELYFLHNLIICLESIVLLSKISVFEKKKLQIFSNICPFGTTPLANQKTPHISEHTYNNNKTF